MMIEEQNIAPMNKRVSAFAIDDLLVALFIFIIFYEQFSTLGAQLSHSLSQNDFLLYQQSISAFFAANIWSIFFIKVAYHTFFVWQGGKTIGKRLLSIKVVHLESDNSPELSKAFLRAMVRIVSESFLYIGFVVAFFLPLKQTMHDKLTNCVVVNG